MNRTGHKRMLPDLPKIMLFCPVRTGNVELLRCALEAHRRMHGVCQYLYVDDNDRRTKEGLECSLAMPKSGAGAGNGAGAGAGNGIGAGGGAGIGAGECTTVVAENLLVDTRLESGYRDWEHVWGEVDLMRITEIRNMGIRRFLKSSCDLLLMLDMDVIPHPDLAIHLGHVQKSLGYAAVVSEVYWSKWTPDSPWLPNVWDIHPYCFQSHASILRFVTPGLYRVGGLGACTMISRAVLTCGAVNYSPVYGVSLWGEDRHFSIRACAHGVRLYADTHLPPYHVYRAEMMEEMKDWVKSGCDRGYFLQKWLTREWEREIKQRVLVAGAVSGPGVVVGGR